MPLELNQTPCQHGIEFFAFLKRSNSSQILPLPSFVEFDSNAGVFIIKETKQVGVYNIWLEALLDDTN